MDVCLLLEQLAVLFLVFFQFVPQISVLVNLLRELLLHLLELLVQVVDDGLLFIESEALIYRRHDLIFIALALIRVPVTIKVQLEAPIVVKQLAALIWEHDVGLIGGWLEGRGRCL